MQYNYMVKSKITGCVASRHTTQENALKSYRKLSDKNIREAYEIAEYSKNYYDQMGRG